MPMLFNDNYPDICENKYYLRMSPLSVRSPECCGWLEVSGFQLDYSYLSGAIEHIKHLQIKGVEVKNGWSLVYNKRAVFPIYVVLNGVQLNHFTNGIRREKPLFLTELGFKEMGYFKNPNTGNYCYAFLWKPEEVNEMLLKE